MGKSPLSPLTASKLRQISVKTANQRLSFEAPNDELTARFLVINITFAPENPRGRQ